jgi:hypothetical protein
MAMILNKLQKKSQYFISYKIDNMKMKKKIKKKNEKQKRRRSRSS